MFADEDTFAKKGDLKNNFRDKLTLKLIVDKLDENDTGSMYKQTVRNSEGSKNESAELFSPEYSDNPLRVNIPDNAENSEYNNHKDTSNKGVSTTLTYDIGNIEVNSITAKRWQNTAFSNDSDWSEIESSATIFEERQKQFSQELNISQQANKTDWVGGLYYFEEQADMTANVRLGYPLPLQADLQNTLDRSIDVKASAAYTNATYYIDDQWSTSLGIRYTHEEKTFDTSNVRSSVQGERILSDIEGKTLTWHDWTPRVGIEYLPTETQLAYLSYSQGFKSGGFSNDTENGFEPEKVNSIELGFKSVWYNERLITNISAYHYDYKNLQVRTLQKNESGQVSYQIDNAAKATNLGVELEAQLKPVEDFTFLFNLSHIDATYDEFISQGRESLEAVDLSGNRLSLAPEWQATLISDYSRSVFSGRLKTRLEWVWQTRQYFSEYNEDFTSQGTYGIINANIGYTPASKSWSLSLYGKNLTNQTYTTSIQETVSIGIAKLITPPRRIGLVLKLSF